MPKPLRDLRERLLRAGVAPRHVKRYLDELTDHLADLRNEELRAGRSASDAEAMALAQLGSIDDLANAMIEKRHFQSWCARAPWAMFGIAPALVLATAWGVALFILWSGWNIFLPGATRLSAATEYMGSLIFIFNLERRSICSHRYLSAGESERSRSVND